MKWNEMNHSCYKLQQQHQPQHMYDIKYIKWVIVFFVESSQVVIVPVCCMDR